MSFKVIIICVFYFEVQIIYGCVFPMYSNYDLSKAFKYFFNVFLT